MVTPALTTENVPTSHSVVAPQLQPGLVGQGKAAHEYDFKALRQSIYANNKEEIIKDLNQDLVGEIEELKKHIEILQQQASDRY